MMYMKATGSPETILIAIGNTLRRDDGVAHRTLDLAGPLSGVSARHVIQLTPELALELAGAARVIFLDADPAAPEPRLEPVTPAASTSPIGHAMSPADLLSLARHWYDFGGQAWLCHIPAFDFSAGDSLTPEGEAAARAAAALILGAIATDTPPD